MKSHDLKNEELDRIARRLLRATEMTDAEIERIVGAPGLFASVKARVKAEEASSPPKTRSFWGDRINFLCPPQWQKAAASFAVLAVFLAFFAVLGVIGFKKQGSMVVELTRQVSTPPPPRDFTVAPVENTRFPENFEAFPDAGRKQIPATKNQKTAGQAVSKTPTAKLRKPARKTDAAKRPADSPGGSEEGKFYPVTFAGNLEEGEELHVYRVELPPASLLALGVNLPSTASAETESVKIKTDLLVGADGVTRAVRLVKE